MALKDLESRPLPHRWQLHLNKLLQKLKACKAILESLPNIDQFTFRETAYLQQNTVSLYLGRRKQADGAKVNVWAILLLDRKQIEPPVVFVDEIETVEGAAYHPRAATSLLRKADSLRPPFCFLQFDTNERVKKNRDMLCALVLYQYLAAGLDNCAMHWRKFDKSLTCALKYIGNRFEYQYWLRNGFTYQAIVGTEESASSERTKGMTVRAKREAGKDAKTKTGLIGVMKELEVAVSSIDRVEFCSDRFPSGDTTSKGFDDKENPSNHLSMFQNTVERNLCPLANLNPEKYLVVRLKVGSEALMEIVGDVLPTRRQTVPNSDTENDGIEIEEPEQVIERGLVRGLPVTSIEIQPPSQQEHPTNFDIVAKASVDESDFTKEPVGAVKVNTYKDARHKRDSVFVSAASSPDIGPENSTVAPESHIMQVRNGQKRLKEVVGEVRLPGSSSNDRSAAIRKETMEQIPLSLKSALNDHTTAKHDKTPVIELGSSGDEAPRDTPKKPLFCLLPAPKPRRAKLPVIINLSSDDEYDNNNVVFLESKKHIKSTPEMKAPGDQLHAMKTIPAKIGTSSMTLRRRGFKRKAEESIVEPHDGDGLIEETNGESWRRASQRQLRTRS